MKKIFLIGSFIIISLLGIFNLASAELSDICPAGTTLYFEKQETMAGPICLIDAKQPTGGDGGFLTIGPIAEIAYSIDTALSNIKVLLFSPGIGGTWHPNLKNSIRTELTSFQANVIKLQLEILDDPTNPDLYDNEAARQLASSSIQLGSKSQALINAINTTLNFPYLSQGNKSGVEYASSQISPLLQEITRKSIEIWRLYHPAPTATFIADPATVKENSASVLYWTSSNADNCKIYRQMDQLKETVCNSQTSCAKGAKTVYGVKESNLYGTSNYTLYCSGLGGAVIKRVTIHNSSSPINPIISEFKVEPNRIFSGDSTTFKWKASNASACSIQPLIGEVCNVASSNNEQSLPGCGGELRTKNIRNVQESNTYYLYCDNSTGGSVRSNSIQLTVDNSPAAFLSANPSSIIAGSSTVLLWRGANVTSCSINQNIGQVCDSFDSCRQGGVKAVFGLQQTTTYTLSCQGPAGSAQATTTVIVLTPSGGSSGGTITYSQTNSFYGDTYYLTITGAPSGQKGTLYKRYKATESSNWQDASPTQNWVRTDAQGNARKPETGSWTCKQGDPVEVEIYIKWENGLETNRVIHTCRERTPSNPNTPRLDSLSPTNGPIGTEVTVSGANLNSSSRIIFGNLEVPLFDVASDGKSAKFYIPSGLKQAAAAVEQNCSNIGKLVVAGIYQVSIKNGNPDNKVSFEVTPKTLSQLADDLSASLKATSPTSEPTNVSKNAIACASQANQLETLIDSYLTRKTFKGDNDWDESSWGRRWLSGYSVYLLAIRAYQTPTLSDLAKEKMRLILMDAIKDSNIVYDRCGQEAGNSCAEDYVSLVMTAAAGQLFDIPESTRETTERNYLSKMFSLGSSNSSPGLVKEGDVVKMYNHGLENPVYAGLLFVHLNNAAYAYWLKQGSPAGRKPTLPPYYTQYKESAMKPLFQWIQTRTKEDGSSYVDGKGDIQVSDAPPSRIPAGRFVRAFLGDDAFLPGKYTFEDFSPGSGGNFDVGREKFYNTYNVRWVTANSQGGNFSVSLAANPQTISKGGSATLSWSAAGANQCSINQNVGVVCNSTSSCTSGSKTINNIQQTTTYTLSCQGPAGSASASATVTVKTTGSPPSGPPPGGNPPAGMPGTYTLYLKLGHLQGGTTFVEDRPLTDAEKAGLTVEIWTQPTGTWDFGRKVTTGTIGSPISLNPGNYQALLKGSLPSPYNTTRQAPSGCVFFSISSSQSTGITCTLQAYDKNNLSNYSLPSAKRPSGNTPPMIETDSSLGSYQFVKNVLDISDLGEGKSGHISSVAFTNLYGKKIMLVGTGGKLLIYDIDNPFNPQLLKENTLNSSDNKGIALLAGIMGYGRKNILTLESHPLIYGYGGDFYANVPPSSLFAKINSDWSLSEIEEFKVKEKNGDINDRYRLLSLFRGIDGKPYGLAFRVNEDGRAYGCKVVKVVDLSQSPALVVGEIDESNLGLGYCESGVDYNISKSIRWSTVQPVRFTNKLYLVISTDDVVARLHAVKRSWVSVFDFTDPSQPRRVGMWQTSGLNNQVHFPDASEAERAKIYADAGIIEIDSLNGYFYDIFPHMYDFQNGGFMTSGESVNAFYRIPGPWRYRNGVIVRKLNESGNFDFVSRFTLCEVEGAEEYGGTTHRVFCGNTSENRWFKSDGSPISSEKAFYGIGTYIKLVPSAGTHAYNGLVLMRDLNKSSIVESSRTKGGFTSIKNIKGAPAVVGIMVGNELKIIPDTSDEFLKFKDSLKKTDFSLPGGTQSYLLRDRILGFDDAHLEQVDDKTFAIFQIHGSSIDVTKLTLTQPRPVPRENTRLTTDESSPGEPPSSGERPPERSPTTGHYSEDFWWRFLYNY